MTIAVIGGGLLGVTTAFLLQERGYPVMLVEERQGVGEGTSYKNGAMLTASMSDPWNAPGVYKQLLASLWNSQSPMKLHLGQMPGLLSWGAQFLRHATASHYRSATAANYQLAAYSLAQTQGLRQRLALQYQASTVGTVKLFRDASAMAQQAALSELLKPLGLRFQQLSRAQLFELEPSLAQAGDGIVGGLHFPDDETGDAHQFCCALTEAFKLAGGQLRTGVKVTGIDTHANRVIGLGTTAGTITVEGIVVAAGDQSAGLLAPLKLLLPIKPVKGYSLTLHRDAINQHYRGPLPALPVIDDAMHAAVVPLGKDRLRLVGTAEFAGFNRRLSAPRIAALQGLLQVLYPELAAAVDFQQAEAWAGLRPMSADGMPFIGGTPIEGLYVNTGHGHLGWTMAAGSSQLLVDTIDQQSTGIDLQPYSAFRAFS